MIALLRQASYEWEAAYEGKQYPDESRLVVTRFEAAADSYEAAGQEEISSLELLPLEFNVNKEAWIKRYPLLTMSVVYGVMLLLVFFGAVIPTIIGGNSTNIAFAGGFFLFLLILFGGLHYALCIAPIRRIKKSAPERIVLDADKIVIDGKVFSFFNTERITATPDSYVVTSATFRRNLSITEGGLTYVFPLGPSDAIKKKGPPVFENYDLFYRTLQSIFLVKSARENAPCKFSAELH
ncbi:MAG: hypothetical protein FWH33_06450 [Oscillospiraceae bacterium]|nr:hypothetical protein [Oscillospiraceae bacterium]